MIIKYYYNGWNYIDEVENVRWVNKKGHQLYQDSTKEALMSKDFYDIIVGEKLSREDIWKLRYHYIAPKLVEDMFEIPKIDGSSKHEDIFIDDTCILNMIAGMELIYIRVLTYEKNGETYLIAFNKDGYLLNNKGETVEKIG